MTIIAAATIGPKGLYLLFAWLISAALAGWIAERKGYGERLGLTFGLLLSVIGLLIVLVLPARPGSKWRLEGWRPKRSHGPATAAASPATAAASPAAAAPSPEPPPQSSSD